jgi:hypothetical protein
MNNNSELNKSISGISFRLNHSNYNSWRKVVEAFLQQKILFHHIQYDSFYNYRNATYIPTSIKEKKYFSRKNAILEKEIDDVFTLESRDDELEALEESADFKESFKTFESDRAKAFSKMERRRTTNFWYFCWLMKLYG